MTDIRSTGALQAATACVKNEIHDILQSGNFYTTEEIARELSVIDNALDHLALDDTFLSTSRNWQCTPGNYTPQQVNNQYAAVLQAINQTAVRLNEYKCKLNNKRAACLQENQLREYHQWAMSCLKSSEKDLEKLTFDAADRIKQFGDSMGVTDRYTGYRHNLTRGTRDPFRMQRHWLSPAGELGLMNSLTRSHATLGSPSLDHRVQSRTIRYAGQPTTDFSEFGGVPAANMGVMKKQIRFGDTNPMRVTRGYRTIDSLYPKPTAPMDGGEPKKSVVLDEVRTLNALNACDTYDKMDSQADRVATEKRPYEKMSVQEQAGICTKFPGKTEYMVSYVAADRDVPTSDFKINPSPDFSIYGRPMTQTRFVPSFTEYQTRYEWPDAERIIKLPWLRM